MVKLNKGILERKIRNSAVFQKKHGKGFSKINLKVSPGFVDEYISYMLSAVEINVGLIAERVHGQGRKTIMPRDMIQHFSIVGNETIAPKEE